MAKNNVAAEPSMEDILASIRRIIADEDPQIAAAKTAPQEPETFDEPAAEAEEVLDLGSAEEDPFQPIPAAEIAPVDMDDLSFGEAVAEEEAPQPEVIEDVMEEVEVPEAFAEPEIEPEPTFESAPQPVAAAPAPPVQEWSEPVSAPQPKTYTPPPQSGIMSAHTDTAVSAAFNSLASAIFSSEPRTIEDLTKELLKPLLKQWMDDNLPSLVERLVREEIERVSRGRR